MNTKSNTTLGFLEYQSRVRLLAVKKYNVSLRQISVCFFENKSPPQYFKANYENKLNNG
jgi:hypothetical protein